MSQQFKEIYLPILVFILAIGSFVYIQVIEPNESVDKKIALKATHDPQIKVEEGTPVPSVKINLKQDKKTGVNIKVDVENFTITPEKVDTENRPDEGHLHLFVNGYKIARVYSEWFHIDDSYFDLGENDITVTLNSNDHHVWTNADGSLIKDSIKYIKKPE